MTDTSAVPWPVNWGAPRSVRAYMTQRHPGFSVGMHGGLNLATHVGDDPVAVHANRVLLQKTLGVRPVFLNQVHGTRCVSITSAVEGETADAANTLVPNLACTVMVADCLPVLFCDQAGTQVAAAHAGWRGLVGGVLAQTVRTFRQPHGLLAWLGPCIGPLRFEVGSDVRDAFIRCWGVSAGNGCFFLPKDGAPGKWMCDLAALARWQLEDLGAQEVAGNDGSDRWCTVSQPQLWFSHRRDGHTEGGTGRMAAAVWLTE